MSYTPRDQPPWPPNNPLGNPQGPWQQGPYPYGPPSMMPPYSGLAIAALITGILCGPLGLILGIIGLHDTKNGQKRGRGMAIAGIVLGSLSLVATLGLIALTVSELETKQATDLEVGDCLEGLPAEEGTEVFRITTVDCSEPHRSELFANIDITAGSYPSSSEFSELAKKCVDRLRELHPNTASEKDLGIFTLHPTEGSWDQGDRTLSCFAVTTQKRSGSVLK
ncbi:MAG: DUF4190 domain-containing protein [Nocardiaceae bacterium]|nr:DUF4190 domain-containing protein [Nocardiaceae bacterium]